MLESGKPKKGELVRNAEKIRNILEKEPNLWKESFANSDIVHRLGITIWVTVFKSMYATLASWNQDEAEEIYLKTLSLYFDYIDPQNNFSDKIVDNLNFLLEGISAKSMNRVYINMVKRLNNLKITGNLNNNESFYVFCNRFLKLLGHLGYVYRDDYNCFIAEDFNNKHDERINKYHDALNSAIYLLDKNKKSFCNYHDIDFTETLNEYDVLIQFLKKILVVMDTSEIIDDSKLNPINVSCKVSENGKIRKVLALSDEDFKHAMSTENYTPMEKLYVLNIRNKQTNNSTK